MSLQLEATYENGVLKFDEPLPLKENERVIVRIQRESSAVLETYGIIGWTGPVEVLRKIAEDDEFGILESP